MAKKILGAVVAMLCLAGSATAVAQAPAQMPIQGYLTDAGGTAIDGATSMDFAIYASETGGTALFTETQSVLVEQGYFTAYAGDVGTLALSLFRDNTTLYMSVTVAGEELLPRAQLATVPYAGYAEYSGDAATVGGMAASALAAPAWSAITGIPAGISDGDDDTTYSAGAGLTLTGTTFSVNTSGLQTRVTGTCPAGSSIRAIAAGGTVTCEVDDGATYTAGSGLTLSGTTFAIGAGVVTATHLATNSVGAAEIAAGAVGTSEIATNGVGAAEIAAGAVGTSEIATNGVGAAEIAANAVGASEIAADSVGMSELGALPNGAQSVNAVTVSGTNFRMAAAFTPPASGTCLVTTTAEVRTDTADTFRDAFVRTARQVGAATPTNDAIFGQYLSPTGGSWSSATSASNTWSVTGGTSYRFGCYTYIGGDFVGDQLYCRTSWICF